MPPLPTEERLLTIFADVHYYFAPPSPHPRLHRFDKASYLYIYHDPTQRRSRIEIANNPGTPDLDAFYGSLEAIHVGNSDRFPTLCTLTVDGHAPTAPQYDDGNNWRLTHRNPHDGTSDYLRLHTLDIYFWTLDDARLFLATTKRLLAPTQLAIASSQEHEISSVVQQLEKAAIDPSYRNSRMKTPGAESVNLSPVAPSSQAPLEAPTATTAPSQAHSIPGSAGQLDPSAVHQPSKSSETAHDYAQVSHDPARQNHKLNDASQSSVKQPSTLPETTQGHAPESHSPGQQHASQLNTPSDHAPAMHHQQQSAHNAEKPENYATMPYNPAAPAAPEPLQHREKTPPTADPTTLTGPAQPAIQRHGTDSSSVHPNESGPPGQGYNAPPGMQHGYNSPPASAGLQPQHAHTASHAAQPNPPGSLSFSPPPTTAATGGQMPGGGQPGTAAYDHPPQDPNMHLYSQGTYPQQPAYGQQYPGYQGAYPDPNTAQTGGAAPYSQPYQPQHQQQQPQTQPHMGGYTEFSYNQQYPQQPQQQPQGNPYAMHSQVYRPTGAETMGQPGAAPPGGSKPGTITEGAMRVEKGVNRLMKKLEKRF